MSGRLASLRNTGVHALVLGGFSMAAAALLAATNLVTADEIRQREAEDLQASLAQVIPTAIHDNSLLANTITVRDAAGRDVKVYRALRQGAVSGVAFEVRGAGYAGEISLILGLGTDGAILGVRTIRHNETPGLGDKIEAAKNDWITRFTGLSLGNPPEEQWKVKKDGGRFDQFSGATITPRAVVAAIRQGLGFFAANRGAMLATDAVGDSR